MIGTLHRCVAPLPEDSASYHFFAEGSLGGLTLTPRGNCLVTRANNPEAGITAYHCYLDLSNLPPEYISGQLTTDSLGSRNATGGVTDPPGYVQPSIATIRLWKRR